MGTFHLQLKDYQFSPNFLPSLVTLIMIPSLILLGIWQLNRADQKRFIDSGVNEAQIKTPINLNAVNSNELSNEIYRSASISGKYDNNKHYLLDNRTHKGRAGFHVFTPFIFNTNNDNKPKAILVNRGWITYQGSRSNIPDIQVSDNIVQIKGTIKDIGKSIVLNDTSKLSVSYPKIIQSISLKKLSSDLNYPLIPIIIELDKSETNGFIREWQPYYGSVDKHIAYAVQWFSMAVVLFILYIKVNTKKILS